MPSTGSGPAPVTRRRSPLLGAERLVAVTLLAASTAYAALAARLEDAFVSPVSVLGPRTFPLLVGVAGIVLALALAAAARPAPAATSTPSIAPGHPLAGDWRRVLSLCALALVYAASLSRLGFAPSTVLFLAASFRLLGETRVSTLLAIPVAVAAVALATMRGLLGVHLPEPFLEALLGWLP